jgi:nucleoside-diphosphate-sugar epimerase
MSKLITIVGAGHLAKFFFQTIETDWKVIALTRSPEKIIPNQSINSLKYLSGEVFPDECLSSDIVVWSLPPIANYQSLLMKAHAEFNTAVTWIFISSTSVFGAGQIDESSPYQAQSENARVLIESEQFLKSIKHRRKVSILRPGGLVDEIRHPRNFFAKASVLSAANTNVNLIHTFDVASCITFLINHNQIGDDFNLVSDDHPTKQQFYLPLLSQVNPHIKVEVENSLVRIVNNQKIKRLGFTFKYPTIRDCFA